MNEQPTSKGRIEHPVFTLALNCATREQLIETIRNLHTELEQLKQRAADEPRAEPTSNEMSDFLTKFYTIAPARMEFYRDVLRRWTRHYLARAAQPPSTANQDDK